MADLRKAKKSTRVALMLPTKFIRAPQRNIPEKILKTLHLRSMVHR